MAVEVEEEVTEAEKDKDSFTCEICSHFEICFVRRNISDFMEQHFPTEKPFEVSQLAKICGHYYPELNVVYEK